MQQINYESMGQYQEVLKFHQKIKEWINYKFMICYSQSHAWDSVFCYLSTSISKRMCLHERTRWRLVSSPFLHPRNYTAKEIYEVVIFSNLLGLCKIMVFQAFCPGKIKDLQSPKLYRLGDTWLSKKFLPPK